MNDVNDNWQWAKAVEHYSAMKAVLDTTEIFYDQAIKDFDAGAITATEMGEASREWDHATQGVRDAAERLCLVIPPDKAALAKKLEIALSIYILQVDDEAIRLQLHDDIEMLAAA